MKVTVCWNQVVKVFIGLSMAANYTVEGFLIWLFYLQINHWQTTGQEMVGWMFWNLVLLFIRFVVTADPYAGEFKRTRRYSFHIYITYRLILTIGYGLSNLIKKIPFEVEIKDD